MLKDRRIWVVCLLAVFAERQVGLRAFAALRCERNGCGRYLGWHRHIFSVRRVVTTPAVGHASDRIGRRKVLMVGLS